MAPQADKDCPKDCTYNIHSKTYFVNHWGFLACIVIITAISVAFFWAYDSSYKNTQNEILSIHKQYCKEFSQLPKSSDSIIIYKDFKPILDSYTSCVSDNLKSQYDKIQNDFTILTIWASVLMIIFLIFSIYSMFKIDEIQKQSRESLKLIDDTYSEVRQKSDKLDTIMGNAMTRIEGAIESKIEEFSQNIKTRSGELEKKIQDYKQTVEDTAKDNQQLFEAFVKLLHTGVQSPQTSTSKKNSKRTK